jgi:hypothetical protein
MATVFLHRFARAAFAAFLFTFAAASAIHAQSAPAPDQAPASAQSQPQAPAKKIWTNENLGGSHSQAYDSSATGQQASNSGSTAPVKSKSKKDAKWYHDQIAKLQAQIPPLDKTIAELQAALDGKTHNEPLHYGGNRIGDWKEQLQQLQMKRQDTLDKIAALEDEARHNGVPTNEIP